MSEAAVKVETEAEIVKTEKRLGRGALIWRRFLRNKTAVVGAVLSDIMVAILDPRVRLQ